MHIKQVLIRNFRSYKDQSEFTPFSPKNNVVGAPPHPPPLAPLSIAHPAASRPQRLRQVKLFPWYGRCPAPAHAAQPSSSC